MIAEATITTSITGVSTAILDLGAGDHSLDFVWAGGPGVAKLVSRNGGTTWIDVEGGSITKNDSAVVTGNRQYAVDVTTATSALTVRAKSVSSNLPSYG
jgi:hypothetical protein